MPIHFTFAGLFAAAAVILVTTIDDCVWLVPFIAQAPTRQRGLVQFGGLFVATFCSITAAVSFATLLVGDTLVRVFWMDTLAFTILGAAICWGLAGYFYYKKLQRRRQRERQQQQQSAEQLSAAVSGQDKRTLAHSGDQTSSSYGAVNVESALLTSDSGSSDYSPSQSSSDQPKIWMVISLTALGSMDEIAYFPGLILGNVFTVSELVLGSLLAAVTMLVIVVFFLNTCHGLIEFFDRIPLYAVITMFAVLLTIDAIRDIISED